MKQKFLTISSTKKGVIFNVVTETNKTEHGRIHAAQAIRKMFPDSAGEGSTDPCNGKEA